MWLPERKIIPEFDKAIEHLSESYGLQIAFPGYNPKHDHFCIEGVTKHSYIALQGRILVPEVTQKISYRFNRGLWWTNELSSTIPKYKFDDKQSIEELSDKNVPWLAIEEITRANFFRADKSYHDN